MTKDKVNTRTALTTLSLGWLLTITAFFIEPAGVVHDSVLWVLGQSLTFAGSLLGAKSYIDYKTNGRDNIFINHDTHSTTNAEN